MEKIDVLNLTGTKVSDVTLSEYVFGITPHQQALYDVVNAQRAAMRQGTHDVKNRSEVAGGGRKPWRQKGTGRARQGSIRSPQWRGGGVVFGPTPRKYNVKVNKKVRNLAFRSALSHRAINKQLIIVENMDVVDNKTKTFIKLLADLKLEGKTLFVASEFTENAILASRNVDTVLLTPAQHVSVYDLLDCKAVVMTTDAVKHFEEVFGK